jgi:phytoene dehydrogenase-like protein
MTRRKITVVGGGWAGLAAAATAARAGADVTVLEARSELGGRGHTENLDGFLLNQGAHALYANFVGMQVLTGLGIIPKGNKPSLRGYGRLRGKIGLMPGTPLDSLRSPMIDLRTKFHLGKLLASPKQALKTDMAGMSMHDWINAQTNDEDARLVIAMAARTATYQGDMRTIAACVAVPQMIGALVDSVLYLDGGWQQIVSALRDVAVQAGATITTDAKVDSLDDVGECDAVILAAGGPRHAASLLGDRSSLVHEWAERSRPVYAATLDLGLRSLPIPERRFVLGVDSPLYMSVHTPAAALAPNGGEVVHVIHYDPSAADVRGDMEQFLDEAQPGWRGQVVAERFGRQRVVAYDTPLPERGDLSNRPGPAIADCPNVFIAGDWVGAHGLIGDAALASGRDAALAAVASLAVVAS